MAARARNRFRLAVVLGLAAVLALASFWLLEVIRKSAADGIRAGARNEPDYYVEKFNFVRMSRTGEAQYSITGKRLVHHPADDTHAVEAPLIRNLNADRPPMTASSKRATVDRLNNRVLMYDNVQVDRSQTADSERMQLSSDFLVLLTDQDIIRTDRPVVIKVGESVLTGTGMLADNAKKELHLSSHVKAIFPPRVMRSGN
jgi:lipopolysaccharide export system protein LptC